MELLIFYQSKKRGGGRTILFCNKILTFFDVKHKFSLFFP